MAKAGSRVLPVRGRRTYASSGPGRSSSPLIVGRRGFLSSAFGSGTPERPEFARKIMDVSGESSWVARQSEKGL